MKKRLIFCLLFIIVFGQQAYAQGCSQCKMIAQQGSSLDEASFGSNINYGILYIMIIPYLLIMFLFRKNIIRFFKSKFAKS